MSSDEIGRGTTTFDGLSIAWACLEQLHEVNRCRTLFATHYHELTALAAKLPALACHTMRVKEWKGDVVFLHEVAPGTADRSYGIHVAKLAGLPLEVTSRAEPTDAAWKTAQKDFIQEYVQQRRAQAWTRFLDSLKDTAKIQIDSDQLAAGSST